LIGSLLCGCKGVAPIGTKAKVGEKGRAFPDVVSLDTIPGTGFEATMQNTLAASKNEVYSPAYLFAWDELRRDAHGRLEVLSQNADLLLVNSSQNYKGSLDKNEYQVKLAKDANGISIRAEFKKELPFTTTLDSDNKFIFKGKQVKAFGMNYFDEKIACQIKILYYENDDRFILKIIHADERQELIFAKGFGGATFEDEWNMIRRFWQDKRERQPDWKYELQHEDQIKIPVMMFNYEANYERLIGTQIKDNGDTLKISEAWQRNAFLLDENGARVESEAVLTAAAPAAPPEGEDSKPHLKRLFLNKNFILVLTKAGAQNPYLMVNVTNTDFMVRR
jgi:hypothetical protein